MSYRYVANPIKRHGYTGKGRHAMLVLRNEILPRILLRRTKEQCADDLALPPRWVHSGYTCWSRPCCLWLLRPAMQCMQRWHVQALVTEMCVHWHTESLPDAWFAMVLMTWLAG